MLRTMRPSLPLLKRLRYALEYAALRAAVVVIPLLPLSVTRALAAFAGTVVWALDPRGRSVIHENLRVAFGDTLDARARRRLARRNYRAFARTFCELFWSPRLSRENWDRHFVLQCDTPAAERALREGKCIFATAHFGNFEWLSFGRSLLIGPSMILAQDFKNPPLTAIFNRLRAKGRQTIIPREGAVMRLFRHLRKGGSAAALVDLNVRPDQSATVIRCFGKLTCISAFHVALAAMTNVPLVPCLALPRTDGRWTLRFFDPLPGFSKDNLQEAAQACWNVFEPVFREYPEHWMWLYKHWRYLPNDAPPEHYPAYANRSKKFDRLWRSLNHPKFS